MAAGGTPRRVFGAVAAALLAAAPAGAAVAEDFYLVDAHSQVDHTVDLDDIVPLMDAAGIRRVILAPREKRKWQDVLALARRHPDRIIASVRTKGGAYRKNKPKYYRFLEDQLRAPGFGAMEEVIMWHAKKGRKIMKAAKVVVHPGDRRVQVALAAAMERGWPFVVHIEFQAAAEDSQDALFMTELEVMLAQHPDHPFALTHMGQLGPDAVAGLIARHPNIYFITSHANPVMIYKSRQPWIDMFAGDSLAPRWRALMIAHADRFILGIDNVWDYDWHVLYREQAALWRKALRELPDAVAHAVAHGNANRLWRLPDTP